MNIVFLQDREGVLRVGQGRQRPGIDENPCAVNLAPGSQELLHQSGFGFVLRIILPRRPAGTDQVRVRKALRRGRGRLAPADQLVLHFSVFQFISQYDKRMLLVVVGLCRREFVRVFPAPPYAQLVSRIQVNRFPVFRDSPGNVPVVRADCADCLHQRVDLFRVLPGRFFVRRLQLIQQIDERIVVSFGNLVRSGLLRRHGRRASGKQRHHRQQQRGRPPDSSHTGSSCVSQSFFFIYLLWNSS